MQTTRSLRNFQDHLRISVQKMAQSSHIEAAVKGPMLGVRHLQCFLLFWAIAFAYGMRVNLSVGIVAMTDKNSANPDFEEYEWSDKVKSLLLSSFFWGYVLTQVPGGFLARRFGGQIALITGISISAIMTILTPLSARIGDWRLVVLVRAIQGASQGVIFPSTHTLLAKWAPKEELPVLATFAYSGSQFGIVVMFVVSGFIATSSFGWPGIFYVSGGLSLIWVLIWYIWGASSPEEHKSISVAEREMITRSIHGNAQQCHEDPVTTRKYQSTPWLKFFTSLPFWALLVTHSAFSWGYWTMLTQIPTFMKNILGFNIKSNALLTSLPYLAMFLLNFVFCSLAALVEKKKWLTLTQSRKFFNTISHWVPAAALVWLGYVDASQTQLAVVLLIVAVGFGAAAHTGFTINHIDLSPNFAGILLGVTSMIANLMSILAPITVGFVVTEETNPFHWRIVFFIAAAFFFFGNLLFVIYGSAKKQAWNEPQVIVEDELKPIKSEIKS